MPDQLALFDLPAAQDAPGAPRKARATKDTAPAPRAAQAPRAASQGAQDAARLTEAAAEHETRLAVQRRYYAELCAEYPAPAPDAAIIARLALLGVTYLGSYMGPVGGTIVDGEWAPSEEREQQHIVETNFVTGVRTILTKTDAGLIALVVALDLPDDLLAAKVRRYGPDHAYLTLADGGSVGIGFAFPTLERNIESARAFLAARERRLASEAERAAQQAAKKGTRRHRTWVAVWAQVVKDEQV